MEDFIVIALLAIIIGSAVGYVIRAKKKGQKCIGCPESSCPGKKGNTACCCCNQSDTK